MLSQPGTVWTATPADLHIYETIKLDSKNCHNIKQEQFRKAKGLLSKAETYLEGLVLMMPDCRCGKWSTEQGTVVHCSLTLFTTPARLRQQHQASIAMHETMFSGNVINIEHSPRCDPSWERNTAAWQVIYNKRAAMAPLLNHSPACRSSSEGMSAKSAWRCECRKGARVSPAWLGQRPHGAELLLSLTGVYQGGKGRLR